MGLFWNEKAPSQLSGSSINSAGGENNEKPETKLKKTRLLTYEKHFFDSTRSERSNSSEELLTQSIPKRLLNKPCLPRLYASELGV